jgi:aspartokinase/homoserine dehydrogenase 1
VATAERIEDIVQFLKQDSDSEFKVAVVSAMGSHPTSPTKVTDLLLNMIAKASNKDDSFEDDLDALKEKHEKAATALLGKGADLDSFLERLILDMDDLRAMLKSFSITGTCVDAYEDYIVGHGELWCARLTTARCRQLGINAAFMDARDVIVVSPTSDGQSVDIHYETSDTNLDAWCDKHGTPDVVICTGFIARTPEGMVTTLKRNGSDYSATIMGALFRSGKITIWSDVDGIYSADPRVVKDAVCLEKLTYNEAWELSYFGAQVLHPKTTIPAMKFNIPVSSRNFFNRSAPGSIICRDYDENALSGKYGVKGLATIPNVALINVEGAGMIGVPGTAASIFGCMRDANVNTIMISQASSEHSVSFAVKQEDASKAVSALRKKFAEAIRTGGIQSIESVDDCCILSAVGQGMATKRGVAATFFSSLAKANVNMVAIAQGSSEYNITCLVRQQDATRALRASHARFYQKSLPIGVALVGPGLIGSTFLSQLKDQWQKLNDEYHVDFRILAIATSKKMVLSDTGVDLDNWKAEIESKSVNLDTNAMADHLANSSIPNTAVLDCTASDAPPAEYLNWMKKGIHVITPNKKLNSGDLARYQALKKHQRSSLTHFFYEGTVGAGLPVIFTLQHIVSSGDKVKRIEGIFSGTLSYIFNTFGSDSRTFSEVVIAAKEAGYTEPNPQDDLAGMDVARKVTILARECGIDLELEQVSVESLVPEALQGTSAEEYIKRLPEFDDEMQKLLDDAEDAGECLRFVGVVDPANQKGSVELRRYPKDHPFATLSGSDNIISFTTERYCDQPLIIRGPGAGAEVTAAGCFSDLLKLASYLGAPS